jgi:hypothetical protein
MRRRSIQLVEKSEAAIIAAIEIYNKPDFKYREETFALLALNAWELLLKAKILEENKSDIRSIYETEIRQKKDGSPGAKRSIKKNRSGTAATVSLGRAIVALDANASTRLDPAIKANLSALLEIRDNASHYMNAGAQLAKQVLEIGTAAVRNYITLAKNWFKRDLSRYNLFLMPIGFLGQTSATLISVTSDERKLVAFLTKLTQENIDAADPDYHVALKVNLSFQRSKIDPTAEVFITTDPSAPHVNISEEDIRKTYPWDYNELTKRLSKKYIDFKPDSKYHEIRKSLLTDPRYIKTRVLDPGNPKSSKKNFYNPNIVQIFDQHYTVKS